MFNIFTRSSTRFVATAAALWTAGVLFVACGGGADSPTSPSTITTPTTTTTTSGGTTTSTTTSTPLAYVNDIKPVLDSDCVACHSPRLHDAHHTRVGRQV